MRLKDKTVVITGGANGIGAVAAVTFRQTWSADRYRRF